MNPTVEAVLSYVPGELTHPQAVMRDGQGGVSEETYGRLVNNTLVELEARLDLEDVPEALRQHQLLTDVSELLIAARICRRMRIHQETADSLFAEANMKLRLYFEAIAGVIEGAGRIELVGDTVAPDPWEIDLSDLAGAFLEKVLD